MAADPDPATRAQAEALLAAGDPAALRDHFGARLSFGTAGLRGALGPGPNRMNRALVRRVTAGLAAVVRARIPGDGPVVVGFDARTGSRTFAEDAARVLRGAGLRAARFDDVCPTPVLAYAVRALRARAGVMVTASHNPPGDNGYKVYGPDGAQIVSPFDREVSQATDAVGEIPLGDAGEPVPPDVLDAYVRDVSGLRVRGPDRTVRIAYTPLHGVGRDTLLRVLAAAGHIDVHVVPEQGDPDGTFPTVAFPNPEEPGALDRVLALAARVGAGLVLANDPDADRIAVAVPTASGWRALTGNEVGTLLAEELLARGPGGDRLVATTIVSSTLLSKIANHHGARYAETLTGFKWIARAGLESPARFVLGYEEALGVCAGEVVRDKDGLSAALLVADLAAGLAAEGRTLPDAIDDLHRRHGVHAATQVNVVLPGAAGVRAIADRMAAVRADPPATVGGRAVVGVEDLKEGGRLPPSDVLSFALEGGDRVLVRPSGTEPKLKAYVEVVEPVADGDLAAARERADARLAGLRRAVTGLVG